MTILEQARAYINTLLPDNILKVIKPLNVRLAFAAAIDAFQNTVQFVTPTEAKKSVTAVSGRERSFNITLDNPQNSVKDLAVTSISRRTLIKGEHFEITGSGTARVLQIVDTSFDNLSPGEKIYYWEKGKGADIGLNYPLIKIVNEAGVAKLKWRWPSETDVDLRYIADMPIPSPFRTADIQHADPTWGNRALSLVIGSLTINPTTITAATDWRTLSEGTYTFSADTPWQSSNMAPVKIYGYGVAVVRFRGPTANDGVVIHAFPANIPNGYGYATLVRFPGTPWENATWQYHMVMSPTINRFQALATGGEATSNSGEQLIVPGPMRLNGVRFDTVTYNKTMNYVAGAWCNTGFRGLGTNGDLTSFNATYIVEIYFNPADAPGVGSTLYQFRASGLICTSSYNSQYPTATVPVVLSQMAHAFNGRTVEFRWEIYQNAVDGAPNLQVRVTGDGSSAGSVPVTIKTRQIF